jgi:hypothetical protein
VLVRLREVSSYLWTIWTEEGQEQPRERTSRNVLTLRGKKSGERETEELRPRGMEQTLSSPLCSSEEGADSRGPKLFGRAGGGKL